MEAAATAAKATTVVTAAVSARPAGTGEVRSAGMAVHAGAPNRTVMISIPVPVRCAVVIPHRRGVKGITAAVRIAGVIVGVIVTVVVAVHSFASRAERRDAEHASHYREHS